MRMIERIKYKEILFILCISISLFMVFRNAQGKLIFFNKYDFKNDEMYYRKIMELQMSFTKLGGK
jgi:hypothetical protein